MGETRSIVWLPSTSAAADFNSDGFVDLLFAPNSPSFTIFGDGHGGTLSTLDAQPFLGPPQGFAADVDGNQTIDLVSPIGSYFPGNGHGGFGRSEEHTSEL